MINAVLLQFGVITDQWPSWWRYLIGQCVLVSLRNKAFIFFLLGDNEKSSKHMIFFNSYNSAFCLCIVHHCWFLPTILLIGLWVNFVCVFVFSFYLLWERERVTMTERQADTEKDRWSWKDSEGENAVEGDTYREKAPGRGGVFLCGLELCGSARTGCNFVPETISLHVWVNSCIDTDGWGQRVFCLLTSNEVCVCVSNSGTTSITFGVLSLNAACNWCVALYFTFWMFNECLFNIDDSLKWLISRPVVDVFFLCVCVCACMW